ncbi:alpha/beta fold hydrolase [Sphingobium abikonense]|uniref:alpha/beta fold hydrolase n=1 Tax=Sphingobium abikonense TaxID=86193 RepID=UPI000787F15B|nr:alpha/beta hydrolase [Sphingobium abikonense]
MPAAPTPTSHFFTSLRSRLHYLDWGNPSAPLLILVHGGFDHAHSWDWTARVLARDFHVIAPDLRGHGDSAWSPTGAYPIAHFVYDLSLLVDLLDRSPVNIIGHSLGGSISLRFAGLFPEKVDRIIAIEGLGLSPDALDQRKEQASPDIWRDWIEGRRARAHRTPRSYPTLEAAVGRMRERNEKLTLEQAMHLTQHGINRNEDGSYSWKFDPYLKGIAPDAASDGELPSFWNRITCPTQLYLGRDSWASNPAKDGRMAHFRDASLIEFDNAGHWLHHDQFDRFIAETQRFLCPQLKQGAVAGVRP